MSQTLTAQNEASVRGVLEGRRRGVTTMLPFFGPAVIASIAYMDPGNFATNIQAGARYGYQLLWVVVLANAIAMIFQAQSAKLGIVTGRNLAELSRDHFPQPVVYCMWFVSEIAAMATDLAEFLGGAIGLSLLLHMSLLTGMAITGMLTYFLLEFERRGSRPLELIIGGFVGVIATSYLVEMVIGPIDWAGAMFHSVVPQLDGSGSVTIAVGIIGATVMPHAIYLHSGLTQSRATVKTDAERSTLLKYSNWEVIIALSLAGLVNMAMVMMASGAFHIGHADITEIGDAYATLGPLLGAGAATFFLVSLIASGISSSVVGTMAGQVIMKGFTGNAIPLWLRRAITMVPAFIVVALGTDPTRALVLSQVVLSIALPIPMVALLILSRRVDVMGVHVNSRAYTALAGTGMVVVLFLNALLIYQLACAVFSGTAA